MAQPNSQPTAYETAREQLDVLCSATGFGDASKEIGALFLEMTRSWAGASLHGAPSWSGLCDDCSPVEFSFAHAAGGSELRFTVEAQSDVQSAEAYWAAADELTERLRSIIAIDTKRLQLVKELFRPTTTCNDVFFAAYHAVVFKKGAAPTLKIYLNPAANGANRAVEVCEQALSLLGFHRVWPTLRAALSAPHVIPAFLSLDLSPGEGDRLKFYLSHSNVPIGELEKVCAMATGYVAGDATQFIAAVSGTATHGVIPRALTPFYLVDPNEDELPRVSIQVPLRSYAPSDAVAHERLCGLLATYGLPDGTYRRACSALRELTPKQDRHLHSWVAFGRMATLPRLTSYFCPRLYLDRFGPCSVYATKAWAPAPAIPVPTGD